MYVLKRFWFKEEKSQLCEITLWVNHIMAYYDLLNIVFGSGYL